MARDEEGYSMEGLLKMRLRHKVQDADAFAVVLDGERRMWL
jgi:hypothetical protein